jgi:hypothetical protein
MASHESIDQVARPDSYTNVSQSGGSNNCRPFTEMKPTNKSLTWDASKDIFPLEVGKKLDKHDTTNVFEATCFTPSSNGTLNWPDCKMEEETSSLLGEAIISCDKAGVSSSFEEEVPANQEKDDLPLLAEEARSDVTDELETLAMRLLGQFSQYSNSDRKKRIDSYLATCNNVVKGT